MALTSGGREALKWVALLLMTGDHVNKALLAESVPWLTDAARVVFPIFAVVLAFNLVRTDALVRAFPRLLWVGLLVQPAHALVFGYWLPANVLLTFAVAVVCMRLWAGGRVLSAILVFLLLGLLVDYQWSGLLLTFGAWLWFRGERWGLAVAVLGLVGVCFFINGNAWALLAVPLLFWLGGYSSDVPRWRWAFLGYYAAHLGALAVLVGL